MDRERLKSLPKIDDLLRREDLRALAAPRWALVEALRREVAALRSALVAGVSDAVDVSPDAVRRRVAELTRPPIRRVVNATGVVLHTNLGRAPLAAAVAARAAEIAACYSNLEYDTGAGRRGSRHSHLAGILRELTGAEDAVVVNNNAAAVLICIATLATGREVVVSRGELIEIGGAFRIPDVMRQSGAELVEVGTTNKTRASDYDAAIGEDTALLLKVHRSNFRIIGFTEEVSAEELADLGRRRHIPTAMDLGSGAMLSAAALAELGLPPEPSVAAVIGSGMDLVTFSGDKLLGGPQAGILAGRGDLIAAVRGHPLMRALRPDKMTLAALEATLRLYLDDGGADVPAMAMLRAGPGELDRRARALCDRIGASPPGIAVEVVACASAVGGGALPGSELPSRAVAVRGAGSGAPSAEEIDRRLRAAPVPVIARIVDDTVLLDVRTLLGDADLEAAAAAVRALASPAA